MTRQSGIALLTLLLALPAFGSDTGTLRGTVRDPDGAVFDGVQVHVVLWGAGITRKMTVVAEDTSFTDGSGNYSFHLAPGTYDIFFSSPTISPVAKKVIVNANRETVVSPKVKYDKLTRFIE